MKLHLQCLGDRIMLATALRFVLGPDNEIDRMRAALGPRYLLTLEQFVRLAGTLDPTKLALLRLNYYFHWTQWPRALTGRDPRENSTERGYCAIWAMALFMLKPEMGPESVCWENLE